MLALATEAVHALAHLIKTNHTGRGSAMSQQWEPLSVGLSIPSVNGASQSSERMEAVGMACREDVALLVLESDELCGVDTNFVVFRTESLGCVESVGPLMDICCRVGVDD